MNRKTTLMLFLPLMFLQSVLFVQLYLKFQAIKERYSSTLIKMGTMYFKQGQIVSIMSLFLFFGVLVVELGTVRLGNDLVTVLLHVNH